ncbi:DUF2834 domain-containing protein [Arthrobacter antioxidans]|uniref:DUF2834 domain-containing protein n=1 Tax=Arthrobacter antioxidans TaxID=2895818 RepID=UPI00200013B1|nr:DUF2834 domain-containing protein [Arthrobacter antioxidans]
MSVERTAASSSSAAQRPARRLLVVLYCTAAIVGLIGTWSFNLAFVPTPEAPSYFEGWWVNAASSSIAVDVIVVAVVACIFFVVEALRLGRTWLVVTAVILIPLSFAVAIAFTFPLFLGLREVVLLDRRSRKGRP